MDGNLDFETWAAEQRALLGTNEPPPVEPVAPIEDALARWKREAEEFETARAAAKAAQRFHEQRELRRRRAHELALVQAQNTSRIDWAAVLASFNEPKDEGDIKGKPVTNLPRYVAPKHGPALGWPHDVRFSQPLMTVRHDR
jgi:hypothetical protein